MLPGFFASAVRSCFLPIGLALGRGADAVDGQVGALEFLLWIEAQADRLFQHAIDQRAARRRNCHAEDGAHQL